MKKIIWFLLFLCASANAQVTSLGFGLRVTGTIGSTALFRSDAQAEFYGTDSVLTLVYTGSNNDGTGTRESALMLGGNNEAGAIWKQGTLSTMWGATNVGVIRLNAAYFVNGVEYNDVFLRGYGNQGVSFWGPNNTTPPGYRVLQIYGTPQVRYGVQSFGTYYISARFEDDGQQRGIHLGYNSAATEGVVFCSQANCSTSFVTHNSTDGWQPRVKVTNGGALVLNPTNVSCPPNSFCNVNGALYWIGGNGTTTLIGPS